jgi:hypothetical protein
MILLAVFILALVVGIGIIDSKGYSTYEEYCNLECWSRRKPCCRTS